VNDILPDAVELRVGPRYVPDPAAPITLEFCVTGYPGDLGVVSVVHPVYGYIILGSGTVDSGSKFSMSLPITFPPGYAHSIALVGAAISFVGHGFRLTPAKLWPEN